MSRKRDRTEPGTRGLRRETEGEREVESKGKEGRVRTKRGTVKEGKNNYIK